MNRNILMKLERIRTGKAQTMDLFSGAGGLSLGFQAAGCEVVGAVESEHLRAATHAANFHGHLSPASLAVHGQARDITQTDPLVLLKELGHRSGRGAVDVIVGGPPCQAYARVGRAKLREIADRPEAHLHDKRGGLWVHYLRFVKALEPVAVLMENVPDILAYGGVNIADVIAESLDALGYNCRYTLLNAANFGVPQMRERWFLIGLHKDLGTIPTFPEPTHHFDVPAGYLGTRARAHSLLMDTSSKRSPYLIALPRPHPGLKQAVGCEEALGDLPSIPESVKLSGRGARDLAAPVDYQRPPRTEYQTLMRSWPGFETTRSVTAHVIRYLPRDFETFGRMPEGSEYPEAHATAVSIFHERLAAARRHRSIRDGSEAWQELWDATVPPYSTDKFPNKWVKLRSRFPSRTLLAHLSHDSYSHIHYSATEARTISVREAARLQSFPDGFRFCGAMNAAFGQVGNAVPPLLAKALAEHIAAAVKL
jgi:DNA (cytosine-5)-methyltransferase 1